MSYGYVYVAQIAMGANNAQTLKAIREAEAYPGPSLIIAYSPCINHGLREGMGRTQHQTKAAVEAGVSAYVVDGLQAERIKPVIDTAIARFQVLRQMRTELAETRRALEERKVIDRAKGLLMKAKGISEDEAYALLRNTAMNQNRRVAEVAEALVTASGLLS